MADLNTKDFATILSDQVKTVQGFATELIDLTVGSTLRAILEANAGVVLWLQSLILDLLLKTRLSTSTGQDVDTFVADYGLPLRLAGNKSVGQITFARFTASQSTLVPVGTSVQSADGTRNFIVIADTQNINYSPQNNGYLVQDNALSIAVPAQCTEFGFAGNLLAGTITTLTQTISGIDTVNNLAAFVGGQDQETDDQVKSRFLLYIASLSKATKSAIGYAISTVKSGLKYALVENVNYAGTAQIGHFYVIVDDGTGAPSSDLLSAVYNAIDSARAFTVNFAVFPPTVLPVNITLAITTDAAYSHADLTAAVSLAIKTYVNTLSIGESLAYSRVAQIAHDNSSGVINVNNILINGAAANLSATPKQVLKANTVTVS